MTTTQTTTARAVIAIDRITGAPYAIWKEGRKVHTAPCQNGTEDDLGAVVTVLLSDPCVIARPAELLRAREWLAGCTCNPVEAAEIIDEAVTSDIEIIRAIERGFPGGWEALKNS